jgi:CRISPR-associated protein Cas2
VRIGSRPSKRLREFIWDQVTDEVEEGNAVMAWNTNRTSGYDILTVGKNRRIPVECDGLRLLRFLPPDESQTDL